MPDRSRAALAIGLGVALYGGLLRPRMLRWGASEEEVRAPCPGCALIPGARGGATMACTIDAPPRAVWPWLVQMGCDRAGFYSWDRLDNGGRPSAQRIRPEWQSLAVGDRIASTTHGRSWFEVLALQPERLLVLRAPLRLGGRPFDSGGPRPRFFSDSLWSFELRELPGARTRLVVDQCSASHPRALTALGDVLLWEPAHWIMQTRQLANLRRRAEGAHRSGSLSEGATA